jgi:hypothetical protein
MSNETCYESHMGKRRRRMLRESQSTELSIPLPPRNHPIWGLGQEQVEIALAICNAFLAFHYPTKETR